MTQRMEHEPGAGPVSAPVSARERAVAEQNRASDPGVSAFVAASAGSGKTKLLTDRLLRLMLGGADPARIQCLTFTKAAAAEMAVRLQKRLGRWVTLDDAALDRDLLDLQVPPSPQARRQARELFARVLDLPGGMRVGTIHAFCQSLLRRFPLEAELSPHFQLVDEADARSALDEAQESVLAGLDSAGQAWVEQLAGLASAADFGQLVSGLLRKLDRLSPALALGPQGLNTALRRAMGVGDQTPDQVLKAAVRIVPRQDDLVAALRIVAEKGSAKFSAMAVRMLDWLGRDAPERAAHWGQWLECLLTKDGEPRAGSGFCNKALLDQCAQLPECIAAEQARVLAVEESLRAVKVADATAALLNLAAPILRAYQQRKTQAGFLDYEDLIGLTSRLLVDPGAGWVLYKLDGGLDHLLLDEVQDTSDPQWRIADSLTTEFFAGEGTRATGTRSFFAVGDPKQSIYSFQGADPQAFDRWRDRLRGRAQTGGQSWRDVPLDVSFRSTTPVLELVDKVFEGPAAWGVVPAGEILRHHADRALHAGRVELWPLAPPPEDIQTEPWSVPEQNLGLYSAPQMLAEAVAGWIHARLHGAARLESADRPLAAGDFLILVRRRGVFDRALVRALKQRDVPVAGLDRMMLTEQPAVQDLLALLDVLLLPDDDLSLACVLVSPLGGLSDDSLMQLAMGRSAGVWDTLRRRADERPEWRQAADFVAALLARTDYTTPHALLVEALGPLGGRARLFARLGPEAAEPVDELLSAALQYGERHPPGLQGFVHWLRQSGAEVKREAEAAAGAASGGGGQVRIMTVHGAKGLQAPVVILPDTAGLPPEDGGLVWVEGPQGVELPLWSPRKDLRCAAVEKARQQGEAARVAEYNRLLYVALTRAEDHLVVCGWQTRREVDARSWYRAVADGFTRLQADSHPFTAHPFTEGSWGGEVLVYATPQQAPAARARAVTQDHPVDAAPGWMGQAPLWRPSPPPIEPVLPRPLAPSRPDDVVMGPVPASASPLVTRQTGDVFRRGRFVHELLQHLPGLPSQTRRDAAMQYALRFGLEPRIARLWVDETLAVLDHPDLQPLFGVGSQAEIPLTGLVNGMVVTGVVDRLAVQAGGVWVADFKTNRQPATRPEDVPVQYLRQMAAYHAVLRDLYPDRPVRCILIWTQGAQAMILPDPMLAAHAPGTAMTSLPE